MKHPVSKSRLPWRVRREAAAERKGHHKQAHFQLFLAGLGVILTLAGVVAAFMQWRVAKLQAETAEIALMPHITIKQRGDDYARTFDIYNEGTSPATSLQFYTIAYMEIEVRDSLSRKIRNTLRCPFYHLVAEPAATGASVGHIASIQENSALIRNFQKFDAAFDEIRKKSDRRLLVSISYPTLILGVVFENQLQRAGSAHFEVTTPDELIQRIVSNEYLVKVTDLRPHTMFGRCPDISTSPLSDPIAAAQWFHDKNEKEDWLER